MDDANWCPVCDRQIIPKRFLVPIAPPPSTPPPPPSSPISNNAPKQQQLRSKAGTIRARAGLVHGTGRVKPNGALKQPPATTPPATIAQPVKHRTIIDQGPIPLYCSDECQMVDLNNMHGAISPDYNPDSMPPAPQHKAFTLSPDNESDNASTGAASSSVESLSSMSSQSQRQPPSVQHPSSPSTYTSPSIATLAAMYNFPPLPPPPPLLSADSTSSSASESDWTGTNNYQSGVMMASRRIKAALNPEPTKSSSHSRNSSKPSSLERKPIPGWTDGSHAWRASVYSFSAPPRKDPSSGPEYADDREARMRAYGSFAASPHRSRGVYSTLGESTPTPSVSAAPHRQSSASSLSAPAPDPRYTLSFSRLSSSTSSLPALATSPSGSYPGSRRRERSILQPGAEGRLLVPDVKLRGRDGSVSRSQSRAALSLNVPPPSPLSPSLSTASSLSWRSGGSSYPTSSRRSVRSPLSRYGSELGDDWFGASMREEDEEVDVKEKVRIPSSAGMEYPKRPTVETRSWSYDNFLTYPTMPLPKRTKIVKKKEVQRRLAVVDGIEKEVDFEVEVEVEEEQAPKRLFLFAEKQLGF